MSYEGREELGRAMLRYFALAIGDDNPLYHDEAYARAAGYPTVIAPPTFVCETLQPYHRPPDADGYIGHGWDLPGLGTRFFRAGHEYEFFRPVLATDRVSVTWRIEDMVEKTSSRGGTLLFVTSTATFYDVRGERLAVNRETIVYAPEPG